MTLPTSKTGDSAPLLRFATASDLPAVRGFLAENFPPDSHQNRPGWLEWQLANPLGTQVAVAMVDGELAGLSLLLRVRVNLAGVGEADGAFATSTMVSTRFRRRGIGSALHHLRAEHYGYALSTGQSTANSKVYERLGFSTVAEFSEFLLSPRWPRFFPRKRWLRHLLSWGRWRLKRAAKPGDRALRLESSPGRGFAVPDEWFRARAGGAFRLCITSNAYLEWRYADHPYLEYASSWILDGERPVGVVIHRALANGELRVVDLYCGPGDLPAALSAFCRLAPATHIAGVVAGKGLSEAFAEAGFQVFPHGSQILGKTLRPDLEAPLTDGRWGFLAGDSDKDR
ncbi:MAG: GNAT family N-acetyltransferase [Victivallales bacterium]|nr:GNAT family N-acetyltransferase [Victivallales bacterium]